MFDYIIDIHEKLIVTPYHIIYTHHESMVSAESTCLAAAQFTIRRLVCIKGSLWNLL